MKKTTNKKEKIKVLDILNYEGPVLKIFKSSDNEFVIYDQWDSIVDTLTFDEVCSFLDGDILLTDSGGKTWNWASEHYLSKPKIKNLIRYLTK